MASITTGIQLADNFTAPLMSIINSVNIAVSAFDSMDHAMNSNVDTSSLEAARSELSQATLAAQNLNQVIQQTYDPIQNNTRGQEQFNQSLHNGINDSNRLADSIRGFIGAYATIQTAKNVLGASDEIVQTTSRLNMMNDGLQSTQDLFNMVYVAANDARGSLSDMASVVARFGNNAKDAFSSSAEVVQFANLIQKQMTIAGASTQEAANAELQLSQALGSGVLRGDELNSIFEQAPNLIQNIADYLDVPIGKIRTMAADGELSADVVKAAVFAAADDINANFESMPMTWGQMWTKFQNDATMAFQPVLQRLNNLANTDGFQIFATNAVKVLAVVAGVTLDIFEGIGNVAGFVSDNWGAIGPIVYGVAAALAVYAAYIGIVNAVELVSNGIKIAACLASYAHAAATGTEASATAVATATQYGFNTALLACPITWIVVAIMAAVVAVIALANHFSGAGHVAQSTFGAICGGVMVVITFFKNLGLAVANIALGIWNALGACANNIGVAFNNTISNVQSWWYNLLSTVLSVVAGICEALNKLPFVEFDYSGIVNAADDYAAKSAEAANNKDEYTSVSDAFNDGMGTFQYDSYSDAYASGAAWGDGVTDKVKNTFSAKSTSIPNTNDYTNNYASELANSQIASNTADTAKNTAKSANSLSATSEDLKYLRDIADREYVNKFTTAEIKVSMINQNKINSNMDLDGVAEHLRSKIEEEMNAAAEGEH
nr:MAG TPA: Tail tape measure [Caudoviricetes sp.]